MTEVRSDDFTLIASIEDVIPLYQGSGKPPFIGFETEIYLYKDGSIAASPQECATLLEALRKQGHSPQLEMASAIEYASPALPATEVEKLNNTIENSWRDYIHTITQQGLIPADTSILPFTTLDSAGKNVVNRDRARGLVKGMKLFKDPAFLKVTLLCASTQVSLDFRDPDDLYRTLASGYALSPAIFGIFANHPPTIEGKSAAIDFNPRASFYEAFGDCGGIAKTLLEASNGDDFIRRHIQQVFNNEMLYYYDAQKNIVWPEKPVTFEELKKIGLNTRSNYDLSESFLYNDLKVCNIRNAEGIPTGKRIEVRGFDAGALGVKAAVPFIHALLRDPASREAVEGLLLSYGVHHTQEGWQKKITAARHAVGHHGGKYLDVPFGQRPDGKSGTLHDFCRDLGEILQLYVARHPALDKSLQPVISICKTGISQAEEKAHTARQKGGKICPPTP